MKVKFLILTTAVLAFQLARGEQENAICHGKPDGLILPHTTDGNVFIICFKGEDTKVSCPSDLIFDPTKLVCVPQDETEVIFPHDSCPKHEDAKKPVHLPYNGDCTKFYKCANGRAFLSECPFGLHWSMESNVCDWPAAALCETLPSHEASEKLTSKTLEVSETTLAIPTPTTEGPVKHTLCPADEDPKNPTVLPHPGDCSKFYKCLHGLAHPIACPLGLHFSAELKRCDWPEVAKCDPTIVPSSTEVQPTSTPGPTSNPDQITTEGSVKHSLCPDDEDPKNPTVLPHPKDCSKFYKCLHGRANPISCPAGLHWSAEFNRCDWPEVAKCKPTNFIQQFEEEAATSTPAIKYPQCPDFEDPKNPVFLPYPNDCTKFYKCLHGALAIPVSCPSGLHWSAKRSTCDWPQNAKCDPNIKDPTTEDPVDQTRYPSTVAPTTEAPIKHKLCPVNEDPKYPTLLPNSENCSKYYKCMYGLAYPANCPPGLHWSADLKQCDWPEVAKCDPNIKVRPSTTQNPGITGTTETPLKDERCPKKDDNKKPVFLPYPENCSKFYKCMNGFAYATSCPKGLHWSAEQNRCDWPEKANCNTKQDDVKTTPIPQYLEMVRKDKPKHVLEIIPGTEVPQCRHIKQNTLIPHPTDCSKFVQCFTGLGYVQDCPPGLHWNNKLSLCDHPDNAKCKN